MRLEIELDATRNIHHALHSEILSTAINRRQMQVMLGMKTIGE
jgi:hypothetical protein